MFGARDKFDENTRKIMVFIESENDLTNGGESFFREYESLLKNNLGQNYAIYVLTSAPENSAWVIELKNDLKHPADRNENRGVVKYLDIGVSKMSVDRLIAQVGRDISAFKAKDKQKKVQVFLHFLAHGISLRGKGDGFVGISDKGILTWRELAEGAIEPLARKADETFAVVESCFGGNVIPEVRNDFFYKNNVMLITGAPVWASQLAPSQETGGDTSTAENEYIRRYFRSSVASLALKAGLMGYASEGLVSASGEADRAVAEAGNKVVSDSEGKPIPFFDGEGLKEKYVVRVDELSKYITKKGVEINCDFMLAKRYEDVGAICEKGKVPPLGMDLGIVGAPSDLKVRIPVWLQGSKQEFIDNLNRYSPIPEVYTFNTKMPNASLNPEHGKTTNAVLSVASLSLTQDSGDEEVFNKKAILPTEGLKGIDDQIVECKKSLDKISGDMYDVLKELTKSGSIVVSDEKTKSSSSSDGSKYRKYTPDSSSESSSGSWKNAPAICKVYAAPKQMPF